MPYKDPAKKKEHDRIYRLAHPEQMRAYKKKWRDNHPEYYSKYAKEHPEEINVYRKKWAENHHDQTIESHENYRKLHREELREANKKYYLDHPERKTKNLEFAKRYYWEHREDQIIKAKQYRENNPEKAKKANDKWRAKNKDRRCLFQQNREALQHQAPGNGITVNQWREMCEETSGRCCYCGEQAKLTMDHVVPLTMGGAHDVSNIVPACISCNSSKGNKSLLMYLYARCYGQ